MGRSENSLRTIQHLRRVTDQICRRYPDTERSHVYQTLLLLKKKPVERLNLALLRAAKKTLHV